METAIVVAFIAAATAIVTTIISARLSKQDHVLNDIHVEVNGRLATAIMEIERMQSLITESRSTGQPVPERRSINLNGNDHPQRRKGERDYIPPTPPSAPPAA